MENKMKKIVINGDFLALNTIGGMRRLGNELFPELDLLIDGIEVEMVTPEYSQKLPQYHNIKIVKYGKEKLIKWRNTALPKYVRSQNALLVDMTQAFPIGIKGITCMHDCIPELVPTAYSGFGGKYIKKPLKLIQRKIAINNSVEILTVSEYSKNDIIKLYHVNPDKITVMGNAWQHIQKTGYNDTILNKYDLRTNGFFFMLGSLVSHKNVRWIIAAAEKNPDEIFVVTGEKSYYKDIDKEKFPENLFFTGYLSDEEIHSLMANCRAFILPSIYEGFGIPPLEALSEGREIIVSNAACLPEIYEDAAHYIDPYNYDNIDMKEILNSKISDPQKILDKYSWKRCAEILYGVIERAQANGV
jgi:glycosyltransferase involved in cell wall biosynthesis